MHIKTQNTTGSTVIPWVIQYDKKEQQYAVCFMPSTTCIISLLSDTPSELFSFYWMVTLCMSQRVQLKRGQRVCKSGSAVTLRQHEGKFSGLTNTKTHEDESHLKDLKVIIIQGTRTLWETANSCVTGNDAVLSLIYFVSLLTKTKQLHLPATKVLLDLNPNNSIILRGTSMTLDWQDQWKQKQKLFLFIEIHNSNKKFWSWEYYEWNLWRFIRTHPL